MFLGEYEYKVDSKGRLPLPPKFRQDFAKGLILTRAPETCIFAYRTADFEKKANELATQKITENEQRRKLRRFTFGNAHPLTLDGQGRIALPSRLKEYAQIGDVVIIVGANDYIELWNPELWDIEKREAGEQAWQIIESLEAQQ